MNERTHEVMCKYFIINNKSLYMCHFRQKFDYDIRSDLYPIHSTLRDNQVAVTLIILTCIDDPSMRCYHNDSQVVL